MVTLRCTARLLARLGIERHPPEPPPPTNKLGDWYADILVTRPSHLVVCMSERSGLAVIVEGRRLDTLVPRFHQRLGELLRTIGVPREAADRELAATADLAFGATTNRSARALLSSAVKELRYRSPRHPEMSVYDWSIEYAGRPCGNPGEFPRETALTLLAPGSSFRLLQGGRS
jgi:hypothetical protein